MESSHKISNNSATSSETGRQPVATRTSTPPVLFIQPRLTIGAVDDPLEAEADNVADRVMRMPEFGIQRKCAHCEEDEKLQRKPSVPFVQKKGAEGSQIASSQVAQGITASAGHGSSLPSDTKSFMESRFGADFSNVRIHTDNTAANLSNELNARAFTVGNDIYFNRGQYHPDSSDGKFLLAHELTHVLQQENNTESIQRMAWVCDEWQRAASGSFTLGPGISVSWTGNAVSISANLEIYGPAATAAVASQIESSIETMWTGTFGVYSVSTSVNIIVRGSSASSNRTQINCLPGTGVSNVMPTYWVVGSSMMNYYVGDSSPTWTPAHEFGHLLGLGDRYSENWFMQTFGAERTSTPDSGWGGNIMAEVGGVVQERNIRELLAAHGMRCTRSHLENPL